MGFFEVLFGMAVLNDMTKRRETKSSDSFFGSSYNDPWHDREFDNECDCGYCSDHDYDDGW